MYDCVHVIHTRARKTTDGMIKNALAIGKVDLLHFYLDFFVFNFFFILEKTLHILSNCNLFCEIIVFVVVYLRKR